MPIGQVRQHLDVPRVIRVCKLATTLSIRKFIRRAEQKGR